MPIYNKTEDVQCPNCYTFYWFLFSLKIRNTAHKTIKQKASSNLKCNEHKTLQIFFRFDNRTVRGADKYSKTILFSYHLDSSLGAHKRKIEYMQVYKNTLVIFIL